MSVLALSLFLLLTPPVVASLRFECMWWSEPQMARFDPNHPPAKSTRVVLKSWEYTDPVGVPHPDVVDLVVEGGPTQRVLVQWLEGPQGRPQLARWTRPVAVGFAPGRIPIDIGARMNSLESSHRWPYALKATVGTTTAELPIRPGD